MPTIDLPTDVWYRREVFRAGSAVTVPQELYDLITAEREDAKRNGRALFVQQFGDKLADALQAGGILHPNDLATVDDKTLLAIKGIGPQTIKQLRPHAQEPDADAAS